MTRDNPQQPWTGATPTTPGQWQEQRGSGQWGTGPQTQHGSVPPGGSYTGGAPGWGPVAPPRTAPPVGVLLLAFAALTGLICFFMGFLSWIDINTGSEAEADRWADRFDNGAGGIPGFLSYEVVLNPGKFLIVLGALGVSAALLTMPRYRRAVPVVAVVAVAAWLALLSAALTLPPFVHLGAGAILALIFGFLEVALLVAATILHGREQR